MPRLAYTPPADLYHSASSPPELYESNRVNASLQIYDFQEASPDVVDLFHQTLLRDWIAPQYQESQMAGPAAFYAWQVTGADAAQFAQFAEIGFGGPRPRMRMLIVSEGHAAILDAQAQSAQAWQVALPSFQALMSTLRVEGDSGAEFETEGSPEAQALAGLYIGVKPKFVSAIGPGVGAGSGGFRPARHLYLFSEYGRVYRAYDDIPVPEDGFRHFDFDEAARADPVNSGHYTIEGDQLILRMGERLDETIVVPMHQPGLLRIGNVEYRRTANESDG